MVMAVKFIDSHTPYIKSNVVTPLRINGRMTGYKGLLGSVKVNACVWSVGSAAKNLGRLLTVR